MKRLVCSLLLLLSASASHAAAPQVMFIAHAIQNRVSVINRVTGDLMTTIQLPSAGGAIAWGIHGDKNAERIYVARNVGSNGEIVVIDGSTFAVLSVFSLGSNSAYIPVVERSGRILNVFTSSGVQQYDAESFVLQDALPFPGVHSSVGIHRAVRFVLGLNQSAHRVEVFRERPLAPVTTVDLPCIPENIAVNPRGLFHFAVTCGDQVIQSKSGAITSTHFANNPTDVTFGPSSKFIWAGENAAGASLRRISVGTGQSMPINLGSSVFAVAAHEGRVFAVGNDRLTILDEETGGVLVDRSLNGGSVPITGNGLFLPCSRQCGSVR